jgi:hypothetical protein
MVDFSFHDEGFTGEVLTNGLYKNAGKGVQKKNNVPEGYLLSVMTKK